MVQVVFVHGVATRTSPAYAIESENREALFRQVAFKDRPLNLCSPMWGDEVPAFAWNGQCFPRFGKDKVASFSLAGGRSAKSTLQTTLGASVATVAASDVPAAIDALFAQLVEDADSQGRKLTTDELAQFAAVTQQFKAGGFSKALAGAADDLAFIKAVRAEAKLPASYGLVDSLKTAAGRLLDQGRNLAADGLVALFRDELNPLVARFLGDVFTYLKDGEIRTKIRDAVRPAIQAAASARGAGEGLVLIGHSLGGVILYDMMTSDPELQLSPAAVDLFLTVGSQPGLFEEMKLFASDDLNVRSPDRVEGPAAVKSWLNVYDPVDLFGFRATPVFAKAEDFGFNSATGLIDAHTTYFKRPQFHARLASHLDTLKIA
ncbi:hypothetical protein [Phenylobacterium sp.]|uniref:hypothetical protein n=1 Tax=Phenylobacterium sp. TaxID=1871053 RepID=UPI003566FB6F